MNSMFKKPIQKTAHNPVKASERRNFIKKIREKFPLLSDEQTNFLFPSSHKLMTLKVSQRVILYLGGESSSQPLFVVADEVEGSVYYPTLYVLHYAPQIMPYARIHSMILKKLQGGADLFVPGMIINENIPSNSSWVEATFGKFQKGDLVVLSGDDHWAAIAVARWRLSSDDLEIRGRCGVAVDILHLVGDNLWNILIDHEFPDRNNPVPDSAALAIKEFNTKQATQIQEQKDAEKQRKIEEREKRNNLFMEDAPLQIKRKTRILKKIQDLKNKFDSGQITHLDQDQIQKVGRIDGLLLEIKEIQDKMERITLGVHSDAEEEDEEKENTIETEDIEVEQPDKPDVDGDLIGDQPINCDVEEPNEGSPLADSVEEEIIEKDVEILNPDESLLQCFLFTLRDAISDKDLPILSAVLSSKYLMPVSRKLDMDLNIKATSYKKIGAFLAYCTRIGLIDMAEEKVGVHTVSRVNRSHDAFIKIDDYPDIMKADVSTASSSNNKQTTAKYKVPAKGSRIILIKLTKVRGNKNLTTVHNLENFGIVLSNDLKRDLAKKFSVSVSYVTGADQKAGQILQLQGKYVTQVQAFLMDSFGIHQKYFKIDAKGVTKKDKAVNV